MATAEFSSAALHGEPDGDGSGNGHGNDRSSYTGLSPEWRALRDEHDTFMTDLGQLLLDASIDQRHEPNGKFTLQVHRQEQPTPTKALRRPAWGRLVHTIIAAYDQGGDPVGREGLADFGQGRVELRNTYRKDYSSGHTLNRETVWFGWHTITSVGNGTPDPNALAKAEADLLDQMTEYADLERALRDGGLNPAQAHFLALRRATAPMPERVGRVEAMLRRLGLSAADGNDTVVHL